MLISEFAWESDGPCDDWFPRRDDGRVEASAPQVCPKAIAVVLEPDGTLMAVDIKTGGTLEAGVREPLFETRIRGNGSVVGNYVVSVNGQRFLINEALEASSPAPLTIVTTWTSIPHR